MQRIKQRLMQQALAAFPDKRIKRLHLRIDGVTLGKLRPRQAQRLNFQPRHCRIIDPFGCASLRQPLLRLRQLPPGLCGGALPEVSHRVHIDVKHIEPAPGRRAVRTGALRAGGKQRMNRIKADKRAAACGHLRQHLAQIAKVANAPVPGRAQGIELHAGAPKRLTSQQCRRFITAGGGNNHPA